MESLFTGKEIIDAVETYVTKGGCFKHWTELPTLAMGKAWPGKTGAGCLRRSDDQDAQVKAYRHHLVALANHLWGLYLSEADQH